MCAAIVAGTRLRVSHWLLPQRLQFGQQNHQELIMTNKLEKREEMKRQALLESSARWLLAEMKAWEATRGAPDWIASAYVSRVRLTAGARCQSVRDTPAKWFRSDRPEIDPRRRKRFGGSPKGASILHPIRQCGKSWVIEKLRGEISEPVRLISG